MYINEEHKEIVEGRGYEYIGSYKCGEVTIDGKCNKKGSHIRVKCPYCGNEYDTQLGGFKKGYNCLKCCQKYENSFAYYIQVELNEGLNKYWDWDKNELNPYLIYKSSTNKIWIKCTETNYHGSYLTSCNRFSNKYNQCRCPYCSGSKVHPKDSFGQWLIDMFGNNAIYEYWSDKNTVDPFTIAPQSMKKVWIKCQNKDYHNDYQTTCCSFYYGTRCPYCASHKIHPKDSFAQYHIEHTDKDFIEKYWSDKNTIDPFTIAPNSTKKVWIKCTNKYYHEDYETKCDNFTNNQRCPYCYNKKVHKLDSFGYLYPQYAKYWSKRNKKSPYEVAPKSSKKYWFICEDCGEEFEIDLHSLINRNCFVKCLNCIDFNISSKGEQKINNYLEKNNIKFELQKKFKGLIGIRGRNLSYDFYLPEQNLLIEYQGQQHDHFVKRFHRNIYDFKRQLEHDKRKKQYAIDHNIDLLEIWYWDYDKINEILNYHINKRTVA